MKIFKNFPYGKYDNYTFSKYKKEIDENNYKRLSIVAIAELFFNFFAFIIVIVEAKDISYSGAFVFLISVLISFIFLILWQTIIKQKKNYTTLFFYIYIILSLMAYSLLGITYNEYYNATMLCMMYVVYAIMFMDKPYRFSIVLIIVTILTSIHTLDIKNYNLALVDCFNFAVACATAIAVVYYQFNEKLGKLENETFVKNQRDTDYLTKLKNRISTEPQINEFLKISTDISAMFVIDLDNFKKVNDTLGHSEGDKLLIKVSKILKKNFRNTDFISRIGGDEFVVFLPSIKSKKIIEQKADKIIKEILALENGGIVVGASIGIAYSIVGIDYDTLFKQADAAMYIAKESGKNCFRVHE